MVGEITIRPAVPDDAEIITHHRRAMFTDVTGTVDPAIITWCRDEGSSRVSLHASHDGRRLYEALGFELTAEIRLRLVTRLKPLLRGWL
jgi:hypothetical protein